MPDINNQYVFDRVQLDLIEQKKQQPNYSHTCWGDVDLQEIRSAVRDFYRNQQLGYCSFCRQNVSLISPLNSHVEHIVPKSRHIDFMFMPKNLCVICADCNTIKREQETLGEIPDTLERPGEIQQYPRSSNAFKIVHPHFDIYVENILEVNGFYLDLTPKGHFTIGACKLNRKLQQFGWENNLYSRAEISEVMNRYLAENEPIRQAAILERLKRMILLI
jgi:hypothetical protein